MNGNKMLNAIGDIAPEHLTDVDSALPEKAKTKALRWGIIAACVCILLGSVTTVFATTELGTTIVSMFKADPSKGWGKTESGYRIEISINKVPTDTIKGQVLEAKDIIIRQYENYKPHMSRAPFHYQKRFDCREAALSYIESPIIKTYPFELEHSYTTLDVIGDKNGEIHDISVHTYYNRKDTVGVTQTAQLYTDKYKGDIITGVATLEGQEYSESYYTTSNNKRIHIIKSTPLQSGYEGLTGYLVEDSILYKLHISCQTEDNERAYALLTQWAESF